MAKSTTSKSEIRAKDQIAQIRDIADDVYNALGSGFPEGVYDRAMQVGLRIAKIKYEAQKVVELKYKDHCVGEGYPDLVIHLRDGRLIVELKAMQNELGPSEDQQLLNYMRRLGGESRHVDQFPAAR